MGARQSKRSVDITATPKRTEGEDQPLEGKLEKIEERDLKPAANGATAHSAEPDIQEEEVLQNGSEVTIEEVSLPKSPEADTTLAEEIKSAGDEKEAEKEGEKSVKKEKEKKDKVKKKWSFRSISFSKKDKSKPARDEGKNGDLTKEGATAEPLTEANEEKPESSEGVAVASEPEAQTQKSESAPEADATLPPKEVESIEKKDEGKAEEKSEVKAEDKIEIKAEEKEEEKIEVKAEEKTEVKSEEPVPKTEELKEVPASPVSAVVEEKGAVVIVEVANVVVAALSEEVPPPLPASPPPVDTAPETLSAPVDSLSTEVSPPLLDSAPAAEISVETVVAEMVAKVTQEEPVQAVPKVVEEVKDAAEQSLKEPVAIISEAVKEVLDTVEVPPPVNEVVKVVETAPTPVEETPAPVEPTPTSEPALIAAPEPTEVLVNKLENGFPEPELGQQIIDEPIKKSEDVKSSASEQVSQIQESVTVGNDSTESSKPRTPVEE